MSFKDYLTEENKKQKYGHIEHLEDFIIDEGMEGFTLIRRAIEGTIKFCNGEPTDAVVTSKIDGSPGIIFGTASNGKFWVATKSLFNKRTPKINFTPEDINRNHQSPGLNKKLNAALKYLPSIRAKGIVAGDILFTQEDVETQTINRERMVTFKANTIVYGVPVHTDVARAVSIAKIGVAVHTTFKGSTPENMVPTFNPSISFKPSQDVFIVNPYEVNVKRIDDNKMKQLLDLGTFTVDPKILDIIRESKHSTMFKKYVNQLVKNNELDGNVDTFYKGLIQYFEVNDNRIFRHFDNEMKELCDVYLKVMKIKHLLLQHLSDSESLNAFIKDGDTLVPVSGEGFVVVVDNIPLKLIDRTVFSRANFTQKKPWDDETDNELVNDIQSQISK